MQWYKHYIADYQQDTADLTLIEQGAYRALLDAYYQREGPLPNDMKVIHRLCRAHHFRERQAVSKVLQRYFNERVGAWFNTRADEEILKYQRQCAANRGTNRIQNRIEENIKKEVTAKPVLKEFPKGQTSSHEEIERNRAIAGALANGNAGEAARIRSKA